MDARMKLETDETELVGRWVSENGSVQEDSICERIEWLVSHYLRKLAISPKSGAWETLYQDPQDGRFWERTYPHSESHGGGPPCLRELPLEAAKTKYLLK